ncbi:AbrB/MazE/SpoVT family DNA-binding domain-containing protein [Deinococcus sp.]|uniref:AbrB/MazE/SpoVT family DNA-binding domain-containing protein n=1 Tax=Deinococcus sp. TaxID=47478 RepID=UPI003CC5C6D6
MTTLPKRGTLSSKGQITIPASILRTLRLQPGDKLEFELEGQTLKLRPSRPDMLATLLAHQIHDETETDITARLRTERGWDDWE